MHLNERFLRAAFTTSISLDDSSFKRDSLDFGHLQSNISGSGGEITVVVVAIVTLLLLITLIPGSLCEFLCFGFSTSLSFSPLPPLTSSSSSFLITASFSYTIFSNTVFYLLSNVSFTALFYHISSCPSKIVKFLFPLRYPTICATLYGGRNTQQPTNVV